MKANREKIFPYSERPPTIPQENHMLNKAKALKNKVTDTVTPTKVAVVATATTIGVISYYTLRDKYMGRQILELTRGDLMAMAAGDVDMSFNIEGYNFVLRMIHENREIVS